MIFPCIDLQLGGLARSGQLIPGTTLSLFRTELVVVRYRADVAESSFSDASDSYLYRVHSLMQLSCEGRVPAYRISQL